MSLPSPFPNPFPLTDSPLEFTPYSAAEARYSSFLVGEDDTPLSQEVMTALNIRPPFNAKPAVLASFDRFTATVDVDDVVMPEHFRVMIFLYAKTKLQPYLDDVYNPSPAPWGGIALVRFRPVITGTVIEDALTITGTLPKVCPVVAALIVVRGLFAPSSVHVQQTYEPAQPGQFPPPGGDGGGGIG